MELILDSNRNSLLALDLKVCTRLPGACQVTTMIAAHFPPPPQVSIATMGIGVGTLWAGLFGMNVRTLTSELGHVSEIPVIVPIPVTARNRDGGKPNRVLGGSVYCGCIDALCGASGHPRVRRRRFHLFDFVVMTNLIRLSKIQRMGLGINGPKSRSTIPRLWLPDWTRRKDC